MLMLAVSAVNAQPGPAWKSDDLKLSDTQQKQLDDLRFQHQKVMIQKKADLKKAELDMRQMMQQSNVDEKAALAKQKEISGIKEGIAEERIKHQLAMRKIFTPEQLQQFLKMHRGRGLDGEFHRGEKGMRQGMRSRDCMGPGDGPGSMRRQKSN
jgi:Spy/CpxP family protein refolding chaperone